jgi:hypothetical protein
MQTTEIKPGLDQSIRLPQVALKWADGDMLSWLSADPMRTESLMDVIQQVSMDSPQIADYKGIQADERIWKIIGRCGTGHTTYMGQLFTRESAFGMDKFRQWVNTLPVIENFIPWWWRNGRDQLMTRVLLSQVNLASVDANIRSSFRPVDFLSDVRLMPAYYGDCCLGEGIEFVLRYLIENRKNTDYTLFSAGEDSTPASLVFRFTQSRTFALALADLAQAGGTGITRRTLLEYDGNSDALWNQWKQEGFGSLGKGRWMVTREFSDALPGFSFDAIPSLVSK